MKALSLILVCVMSILTIAGTQEAVSVKKRQELSPELDQVFKVHSRMKINQIQGSWIDKNILEIDTEIFPNVADKEFLEAILPQTFYQYNVIELDGPIMRIEILDERFMGVLTRFTFSMSYNLVRKTNPEFASKTPGGHMPEFYIERNYYADADHTVGPVGSYTRHCCGYGYWSGQTTQYCDFYQWQCVQFGCTTVPGTGVFIWEACN